VAHQFLDVVAGGAEVFARVEFLGVFEKDLADAGRQRQTEVGVDIDLGAADAAGDLDIRLGNPGGVGAHFAAVFVDFLDQFLGNAGGTVKDQGIIAQAGVHEGLFDGLEAFEVEVLLALELVGAMGVADRDGERIHAGKAHELDGLLRVGVVALFGVAAALLAFVKLGADQLAQLSFDHAVVFVGVFHNATADLDVLLQRVVAGINHDAREALVDAILAQLEAVAVVQMHGDRDVGQAHGRFDEFLEIGRIGVASGAFGNLEDDRGLFRFAGLHDGLEQLHIVDVEGPHGVLAFEGFGKQISSMCQWHKF